MNGKKVLNDVGCNKNIVKIKQIREVGVAYWGYR
jgi:hypothetical protein